MVVTDFMHEQPLALALLLACIAAAYALARPRSRRGAAKSLPSPPGALPLLGHLPQLGKERPWVKLKEWSDVYGASRSLFRSGE
jgi:hypothetical protein